MTRVLDTWRAWALADLERRHLQDVVPVVDALAQGTAALREAAWNESAAALDESHAAAAADGPHD